MSKNKKIAIIIILVSLVIAGVCILAFIYPHKNTKVEIGVENEMQENAIQDSAILIEQTATNDSVENQSKVENAEEIASTEIIENAVEQENLESNSSMETKTNNTAKINKNSNDNQQKTSKTQSGNNTQKSNSSTSKTTTQAQSTKTTTKVETQQAKAETQKVETQTPSKPVQEQQVPEEKPVVQRCTNNSNHGIEVGNCNKWYSSKSEAVSAYNSKISEWGSKWENGKIDNETYYKNCPYGYEVWSCPYCNKWTINYYYR